MPSKPEGRFPSACHDVDQFNSELLRWLFRSVPGATLGQSHDEIVTTVPIGRERCVLRGGTTRDGVADYLERTLKPNAAFFVAASTKKVVHRVTVGREGRIRGLYLYTSHTYDKPRPPASADGSPFGEREVWFKIMDAVALLHTRGHQRLRVIPTLGDIAPHLFVVLAEGISYGNGCSWRQESKVLAYSMACGPDVGKLIVGPDTPLSAVAEEILAGTADKGIGIDWAYAGWYVELLAEAHRLGVIPVDNSDFGTWALGYHSGRQIPFPPPPVYRAPVGFTDVFPQTHAVASGASSPTAEGSDADVMKLPDTALVASFSESHDGLSGLFALTPEADYHRERGTWVRYDKDDEIDEDLLVPVSYRFITAFDFLEAQGKRPDRSLADQMRVFSGPPLGPSGTQPEPQASDGQGHGPDLMTAKEIVDTYGVALKTIQRWLNAGKLHPAMKLPGKTGAHLFTREEAEHAFGKHIKHKKTPKAPGPADTTAPVTSASADPKTHDTADPEATKSVPVAHKKNPTTYVDHISRNGDQITVDLGHPPHTVERARSLAWGVARPDETLEYLPDLSSLPGLPESSTTHYVFAVINPKPLGDFTLPFTYRYA